MADFPSWQDLFRIARDEVLSRNPRLSRDAVEREGMDANVIVAAGCGAADEVIGQLTRVEAGVFLDSAVGDALDRLVFDRYGLVRKPAAAALGSVDFFTTVAAALGFTIPAGTLVQTPDGIQFITTEDKAFAGGTTGPYVTAARSVLAGGGQQAKANSITSLVSQITGSPADLQVNNPLATSGAADAESDASLRDRARRFFLSARRGTLKALEEGALAVPGVTKATAYDVLDSNGRPARVAALVVTDEFTEQLLDYSTVPASYQTQSQLLTTTVFDALADVRAAGIYVQVIVGAPIIQPILLALTFAAGVNVDNVALNARAAVANYVNALAPGETLSPTGILSALRQVTGLIITEQEVVSPVGAIVPKPVQVIRTTLGFVTPNSAQTNRPLTLGNNPDAFQTV